MGFNPSFRKFKTGLDSNRPPVHLFSTKTRTILMGCSSIIVKIKTIRILMGFVMFCKIETGPNLIGFKSYLLSLIQTIKKIRLL